MSNAELKEMLGTIVAKKSKFKVNGYKSSGSGNVSSLELEYVGPGLYKGLIEESLELIKTNPDVLEAPADCDKSEWDQAVAEQVEAFKTVVNKSADSAETARESSYTVAPEGYVISQRDLNVFGLRNCKRLACHRVETVATEAPVKEAKTKGNKSRFKDMFKARLPISAYVPLLTFTEGKFDSIELS